MLTQTVMVVLMTVSSMQYIPVDLPQISEDKEGVPPQTSTPNHEIPVAPSSPAFNEEMPENEVFPDVRHIMDAPPQR